MSGKQNYVVKTDEELRNLLKDSNFNGELIIEIPGKRASDYIQIFEENGRKFSRTGFKKWSISSCTLIKSLDKPLDIRMAVVRFFCLASAVILFSFVVFSVFSIFWNSLESYLISLPLATGLASAALFALISAILGRFLKKKPSTLLRNYLGFDDGNGWRKD